MKKMALTIVIVMVVSLLTIIPVTSEVTELYIDEADKIQEAIDLLGEEGGIIHISPGTYYLESGLHILSKSNITLQGSLEGDTILVLHEKTQSVITISESSDITIKNLTIKGDGIGIRIKSDVTCTIACNHIIENDHCGIYMHSSVNATVTIINNVIAFNGACGIAYFNKTAEESFSHIIITNNTISYNEKYGVYLLGPPDTEILITNNIITDNSYGIHVRSIHPSIEYNDVWNNQPSDVANLSEDNFTNYSGEIEDQTGQDGNISVDPLFVNPEKGNLHLMMSSPCINAGMDTNTAKYGNVDIDNEMNDRPEGETHEMGAYEVSLPEPVDSGVCIPSEPCPGCIVPGEVPCDPCDPCGGCYDPCECWDHPCCDPCCGFDYWDWCGCNVPFWNMCHTWFPRKGNDPEDQEYENNHCCG